MNKQIQKLAEQAEKLTLAIPGSLSPEQFRKIEQEIFAELIVQECAMCMTTPKIQAEWPHDVAVKIIIDTLVQDMCEHFGVE